MAKRRLLKPNIVYIRVINPTSDLKPSLQVSGGTINVYNKVKATRSEKPPVDKNDGMVLDEVSPLGEKTWKASGLSDFFLYEVASGNPRVVGMNFVEL